MRSVSRRTFATRRLRLAFCLSIVLGTGMTLGHPAQANPLAAVHALQQEHNIPLVALAWIGPGAQHHVKLLALSGKANQATPLRWGSITKTVTALTALRWAELNRIDWQAPLHDHLDETLWRNPYRSTYPVRLLHLLELTAGFTDLSALEFNQTVPLELSAALALNPAHRTTRWPPGWHHSYSNLVPGLTQAWLEHAADRSFEELVEMLILQPLEMRGASLRPDPALPGGHRLDGTTVMPYWHMTFAAFGALNAPIGAMHRLLDALLDPQAALPSAYMRRYLFNPQTSLGARAGLTTGYAAGLYTRTREGHTWWTHGGDADGYRSRLALLRAPRRGYVIGINSDNPRALRQIEAVLDAHLTHDLAKPPTPAAGPLTNAEFARYTGTYYPATTRFGLTDWLAGDAPPGRIIRPGSQTGQPDHLVFARQGRDIKLFKVSHNLFRREDDPEATLAFVEHNGALYLQGELGNFKRSAEHL